MPLLSPHSHDIHHQNFGIKSNFSQPFGTIWDHVLGTHMSREEANQIIKMKEERKAARLAAQNHGSNMAPKTTLTTAAVTIGSSIKTSAPYKEQDVLSSGNNSGNDSHEEAEEAKNSSSVRRPSSAGFDAANATSSSVELPGYRELLATRARVDNGFVSGKGQGKAL